MVIYIFGNQDLDFDSIPFKILGDLKINFPDIEFVVKDPNEELGDEKEITLIDTVHGIEKVTLYSGLNEFENSPNLTMHDFDALANLKLLEKLGKITKITIIGIPADLKKQEALNQTSEILKSI